LNDLASAIENNVAAALAEDIGSGDWTAQLIAPGAHAGASVVCRSAAVLCGGPWFEACFRKLDPGVAIDWLVSEGSAVTPGQKLCTVRGAARALLTAERTALNFLQRLSGIATLTAAFAAQARGTRARILDTRKTIPGWRALEKYAVRCGGGVNHRMGLYDAVMVKDNHWLRPQAFAAAVRRLRRLHPRMSLIMEADEMTQVRRALELGADVVMLDNMPPPRLRQAIAFIRKSSRATQIEVSGRVDIKSVRALARLGPDRISIGRITHSAPALDVGLDLA